MSNHNQKLPQLFFILTLLIIVSVTTTARAVNLAVKISPESLTVNLDNKTLSEIKKGLVTYQEINLRAEHDLDSLFVLPLFRQYLELSYKDGTDEVILINKPSLENWREGIKKQFGLGRRPFTSKASYDDNGITTSLTAKIKNEPIKQIKIKLWNVNDLSIKLTAPDIETTTVWLRPKFHHDGNVKVGENTYPFQSPAGGSVGYYLTIIISLISRNLIGTCLVILITLLICFLVPKTKISYRQNRWLNSAVVFTICAATFATTIYIASKILNNLPHSQDEVAYLFQSEIFSNGKLYAVSLPGNLKRFFDQEFIINNGKWFSSFPPGTSVLLAIGQIFKAPELVNPLISAFNILLFILLARKLIPKTSVLVATIIYASSPFFLLISSSYLSHPASLLLTFLLLLSTSNIMNDSKKTIPWLITGLSLGFQILIRPANAVLWGLIIFPFLFMKSKKNVRGTLACGLIVAFFFLISSLYNFILLGNFLKFPHEIYGPYDKLGFGLRGVEWGSPFGLDSAFKNLTINLYSFLDMVFRWPTFLTLAFITPTLIGKKYRRKAIMLISVFITQITFYFFYFNEGAFYGPRFWFEVGWIIPLLTVMGLESLPDIIPLNSNKIRFGGYAIILFLTLYGTASTITSLNLFEGYNGLDKVSSHEIKSPALVFVDGEGSWVSYGKFFVNQTPFLTEPVIYARDRGINNVARGLLPLSNESLIKYFPERNAYLLKSGKYIPIYENKN